MIVGERAAHAAASAARPGQVVAAAAAADGDGDVISVLEQMPSSESLTITSSLGIDLDDVSSRSSGPGRAPPALACRCTPLFERERRSCSAASCLRRSGIVEIVDDYVVGNAPEGLCEVRTDDGTASELGTRSPGDGPAEVAAPTSPPGRPGAGDPRRPPATWLRKRRDLVERDGLVVAIDEHQDGRLSAEIDDGDHPSTSWRLGRRRTRRERRPGGRCRRRGDAPTPRGVVGVGLSAASA